MNRIIRVVLHIALTAAVAACAFGREDEKPVKINDAISMLPATGNVYLVKTPLRAICFLSGFSVVPLAPGESGSLRIVFGHRGKGLDDGQDCGFGYKSEVYVNGADQPCLIVNDLKLGEGHGRVALWTGSDTEAYFSNLRIQQTSR